jgi:hypothetical protein
MRLKDILLKWKLPLLVGIVAAFTFLYTNFYFSLEQRATRVGEKINSAYVKNLSRQHTDDIFRKLHVVGSYGGFEVSCNSRCHVKLQSTYRTHDASKNDGLSYQLSAEILLDPLWTESKFGPFFPAKLRWSKNTLPTWSVWIRSGDKLISRNFIEGDFSQFPVGPKIEGDYPFSEEFRVMALAILETLKEE